jgi:mannitol/fructose-specific phosphotransferase system IIA component (Ntr-type)
MHDFDEEHVRNLERAMRETPVSQDRLIASYLALEAIDLNLPARSRTSVLRELVVLVARTGLLYDPEGLAAALEERESMGATALAGGIAFPHPRRPMPYAAAEPLLALARVPAGIPFGARDGNLTDLFVLICAPSDTMHLGLLARLAMMFNTNLANELRAADDTHTALELLLATERTLLERD